MMIIRRMVKMTVILIDMMALTNYTLPIGIKGSGGSCDIKTTRATPPLSDDNTEPTTAAAAGARRVVS